MKYSRYPIVAGNTPFVYEFFSDGPRGRIRKGVFYTRIGINLFNLGFGDWNEERQDLDDSNRSNNGDRDQVLATVAFTALDFTDKFPKAQLFVEGSTPGRTRLYQMGICVNILEISECFEIKGLIGGIWEIFERNRNYEGFLITRKRL